MQSQHKTCSKCGEGKPLSDYYRDRTKDDGRHTRCKECTNSYRARYYLKNRERILEQKSRYYVENRDRVLNYQNTYRSENSEKISKDKARYSAENRDVINHASHNRRKERSDLAKAVSSVPLHSRWLPGEDALLLADNGMTLYQKAVELGRTYGSCNGRRHQLRKRASA